VVHDGNLYAGTSDTGGIVRRLDLSDTYNDSGVAIDSYFYARLEGGGDALEDFVKDFRKCRIWYELLGAWNMNLRWRMDGATGAANTKSISLDPGGATFDSAKFDIDFFDDGLLDYKSRVSLGTARGRLIQIGFDNEDTADQAFKVHNYGLFMNIRGRR